MMDVLGPGWTFVGYAGVCAVGWVGVWGVYPETMGLGLEEIGGLLQNGYGVRESELDGEGEEGEEKGSGMRYRWRVESGRVMK